jgi:hypothetical protein
VVAIEVVRFLTAVLALLRALVELLAVIRKEKKKR